MRSRVSAVCVHSPYCMYEFESSLQYNVLQKRKKRLIVLMTSDSLSALNVDDAAAAAVLRRYVRQYTYIKYPADDWRDKLLYALPLCGLLQRQENPGDDVQLLTCN